jgi:uncharacterized surface protein with fasciclin (FAS1) repeats
MKHALPGLAKAGAALAAGLSMMSFTAVAGAVTMAAAPPVTHKTDFGPACKAVPKGGAGSFAGMTMAPVATAASHNPVLSTLVSAVEKAGLADTLNNAKGLTVFAPDNSAFNALPKATLKAVLANKAMLTKLLEYHVVAGRLSPAAVIGVHKTIEGTTLSVAGSGTSFNVNGMSQVVCGNVQTANATVYIVNSVLNPDA